MTYIPIEQTWHCSFQILQLFLETCKVKLLSVMAKIEKRYAVALAQKIRFQVFFYDAGHQHTR